MKNAEHIREALHHAAFQHFALLAPGVDPDGSYDVVSVYVFVENGSKSDAEQAALEALSNLPFHASEWTVSCFHAEQEAAIRSAIGQPMTEFHPSSPEQGGCDEDRTRRLG